MDGEAFIYRLKSIGEQISQNRFPPSKFVLINTPGTPADRQIYSRLSPSHMQPVDVVLEQITTMPEFSWMTRQDIETMIKSMPVTDQLHFKQYVALNASSLLAKANSSLNKDRRGASFSYNTPPPSVNLPPKSEVMERDTYTGLPITPNKHDEQDLV